MARIVKKRRHSSPAVDGEPSPSALVAKKIFLVGIFLLAQFIFAGSDFFLVKEITILGNSRVPDSKIIQTANIPLDHNVITLPVDQFRERLASIHWIRDVQVRWHLPGRVSINVVEREPVVLARSAGEPEEDSWFAVDEDGMALYEAGDKERGKFPRLVVETPVRVGHSISVDKVESARQMDPWVSTDLKGCLLNYLVDERGEVSMLVNRKGQQYEIKIGRVESMNRKMEVLGALLELVDQGKIHVRQIDVRSSQYPVILPVETDSTNSDKEKSDD